MVNVTRELDNIMEPGVAFPRFFIVDSLSKLATMSYIQQYKLHEKSEDDQIMIIREAIELSDDVQVDILRPRDIRRRPSDKTPEEVIKMLDGAKWKHVAFIFRPEMGIIKPYYDVGLNVDRDMESASYFIFAHLDPDVATELANKHKLEKWI